MVKIVLKDDPLSLQLAVLRERFIKNEADWQALERTIRRHALVGSSKFNITHLILEEFDWSIKRGVNLFAFITGGSGKGKSLTALTLVKILKKKLQKEGFEADNFTTMTTSETQKVIRTAPLGTIIHQDEMPRLSGSESTTRLKAFYNWMEQSRAQRPFIFFCSPTIWLLPNLHFALRCIPMKYDKKDKHILKKVVAEVYALDFTIAENIKFRLIGYCFVDILPDGDTIKEKYFEKKAKNVEENARWAGTRGVTMDDDERAVAVEIIQEEVRKKHSGKKLLKVTRDKIKDIIKREEISIGSADAEKMLVSVAMEDIEERQEKIRQKIMIEYVKLVEEELIPKLAEELPDIKLGSIKAWFREELNSKIKDKETLKAVVNIANDKFRLFRERVNSKTTVKTQKRIKVSEGFWSDLVPLIIDNISRNPKLLEEAKNVIGDSTLERNIDIWYLMTCEGWNKISIMEKYPKLGNPNSPRLMRDKVRNFLSSHNALKAAVSEQFFLEKLNALSTVSSFFQRLSFRQKVPRFFLPSISNHHPDIYLLDQKTGKLVALLAVKWHFGRAIFLLSPERQYSEHYQLPLFALIIDVRKKELLMRFSEISVFSGEELRVDTVEPVAGWGEVQRILEETLLQQQNKKESKEVLAHGSD